MSFQDRIKLFSGGKSYTSTYRALAYQKNIRESARPSHISNKIETLNEKKTYNEQSNYQPLNPSQIESKIEIGKENIQEQIIENNNQKENREINQNSENDEQEKIYDAENNKNEIETKEFNVEEDKIIEPQIVEKNEEEYENINNDENGNEFINNNINEEESQNINNNENEIINNSIKEEINQNNNINEKENEINNINNNEIEEDYQNINNNENKDNYESENQIIENNIVKEQLNEDIAKDNLENNIDDEINQIILENDSPTYNEKETYKKNSENNLVNINKNINNNEQYSNYDKNLNKKEKDEDNSEIKLNSVKNIIKFINRSIKKDNDSKNNQKENKAIFKKVKKKEIIEEKQLKDKKEQNNTIQIQSPQKNTENLITDQKSKEKKILETTPSEIIKKEKKQKKIISENPKEQIKEEKKKKEKKIVETPSEIINKEEKKQMENIIEISPQNIQNIKLEEKKNNSSEILQENTTLAKSKTERNSSFQILEDYEENEIIQEEKEFILEGTIYDKYLSKLSTLNKKENETNRETFCEGFFIASFPQKNGQVIENSQSFPSPCGHSECSTLPAMKPEIIARYPLKDTKTLELNNLAATICFPAGIKVCYSEESPSMIDDYVTPITNQKGERYYMMTFHFYHKIDNDAYSKLYEMNPLKYNLMKFGDRFMEMSEKEMDEKITNQIQESLEKSQELGFRDYVYVPYCICLISRYRYVNEMKKCLQSIYSMFINHLIDNKPDLNNLIMYLVHSIPIPEKNTKVKFFLPFCPKGIELTCPKVQDISIMNSNISSLLKYFSIDRIIIIFRLILFEKKILFIDDDYTRLSLVTDSFISLLYPFQWVHTYIPIMSEQMLKYLETFLPFINGINSSLMNLVSEIFINNENEDSEEVFLVYITRDKFRLGSTLTPKHRKKYKYLQENVPSLPSSMEKELRNKLKKIKDEIDKSQKDKKKDLSELDFRLRNVFIDMFVQMFHDYYKYMTFLDNDVVFNKPLFLEKITNSNDKRFYDEFIDTQLFQQFTQNIIKDELKYFTTMATNYDQNKKETIKRSMATKLIKEKLYLIKPDYLNIDGENSAIIQKKINSKYKMEQTINRDGNIDSSYKILSQLDKIKDEYYNNQNCYIYTLPESLIQKTNKQNEKTNEETTEYINKDNLIYKALQSLKLKSTKSFARKGFGMTEKEKDNIKETIKDFTIKIFKSEEIEEDANLKKDLQNALNNSFGRDFFVNMLSKNVTNIILLKEKSFQLLGTLIYNSLLFILNIEETNKLLEQMVILVKSTKYFGQEKKKGTTTTIWDAYKSRIQGYSKISQANFWNKWYELEIKKEAEITNLKKEKIILEICDIMINLELTKSFVKNVTHQLSEKEFGKESEQYQSLVGLITEKIIKTKYISIAR